MSFFSNHKSDRCPGPISGNALSGICEKVCIQTNKIFDSCMKQVQEVGLSVTLTDITPANPVLPLTFVSATTTPNTSAYITGLIIERFDERPNFARVRGTVNIPITVTYTDANGVLGTGTTTITLDQDVILYVPQPSIVPFTVEAFGTIACPDATYVSDFTFSLNTCTIIILKVMVEADILVPSYGYCCIPQCQEYTIEDTCCGGNFDLPLFPNTRC